MADAPLRAAVIGAGVIGCGLDAPGAKTPPLTHAGAYLATAGFELAAILDCSEIALAKAAHWPCPGYASLESMMTEIEPQVVSLCLPVAAQSEMLSRLLDYPLRAVVAEKPLAETAVQAHTIAAAYRTAQRPLLVNYTRRFVPAYRRLADSFAADARVLSASVKYAKGLRHNGTHALDLARFLFGEVLSLGAVAGRADHWPDDPTVSAYLVLERCPALFLQGLDERCFTLFEVEIVTETDRVVIDLDGRRLRRSMVKDNEGVPPGKRLVEVEETDTGAAEAMSNLIGNLLDVVYRGAAPACSADDAVAALDLAERIAADAPGDRG